MTKHACRALSTMLLLALLGLGACKVPDPCDPGDEYDHGVCRPTMAGAPMDAGGDGDGDEDAGTEPGDEPDAAGEPTSEFICPAGGDSSVYNRPCTTNADCECPASLCLPLGYCSGTQCMEPGKECPGDGTCLDIAPFRGMASIPVPEEVTHICLY